jgi:hypothetical protein
MKLAVPIVALAMALCLGSVLSSNDLQMTVKVFGCNGE